MRQELIVNHSTVGECTVVGSSAHSPAEPCVVNQKSQVTLDAQRSSGRTRLFGECANLVRDTVHPSACDAAAYVGWNTSAIAVIQADVDLDTFGASAPTRAGDAVSATGWPVRLISRVDE